MKKYLLLLCIFTLSLQNQAQTISDDDGNTYKTVAIGTQIWMAENLKTTKYNDGVTIPDGTNISVWSKTAPAYCWYNNNTDTIKATYGALYNWYAVNTGKLCPTDWHVPANAEWDTLIDYLGGLIVAGSKLKETGTAHWTSPNTADNSSGFTALGGGSRDPSGGYLNILDYGYWWSSSGSDTTHAWDCGLLNSNSIVFPYTYDKHIGFSVRCVKGNILSGVTNGVIDEINIYPNPSNKKLYLKNINSSNSLIEIFDFRGGEVLKKQNVSNYVDISNLKNGVYLVKIIDSGKIKIAKFIKE
jgi:uncharacterized protein (TIGR02145 family)